MTNNHDNSSNKHVYEQIGVHARIFQRGRRWYANFQHNGRQHRPSLGTSSKKEARRRAIQIDADISRGNYEPAVKPPIVDEVIDAYRKYLRAERRSAKTLAKYDHAFDGVRDLVGRRKVRSVMGVNLACVDAFRAERVKDGAAPKTVHNDTVTIRQLVNFALQRGMIARDPLKGLKLAKPKPTPQPCWTCEELKRIIDAATEPHRSVFIVLSEAGMRVGELKHLTWEDIDFDRGVIHIRPKEGWRPKTGDIRVIPMSSNVHAVLKGLTRKANWVFTARPSAKYPRGDHQISERRLLQYLKRVVGQLGLRGHVHTFRHTFISMALTGGVPEAIVRDWVGHVDAQIIRHYTHIADEASKAAMERLGDLMSNGNGQSKADGDSAQFQHNREEADDGDGAK